MRAMKRMKMTGRVTLLLATAVTTLFMSAGLVLAVETINCKRDVVCVGTAKSDTIQGTNGADSIRGLAGFDTMYGYLGEDNMRGNTDSDTIYGGYGRDRIFGEDGNDYLVGDHSQDLINGGLGRDYIDGGQGRDTIQAADGNLDSISCGLGIDTAFVDDKDINSPAVSVEDFVRLTSCENVRVR